MEKWFKMNGENLKISYVIDGDHISISISHYIDPAANWDTVKRNNDRYSIRANRDLMNAGTMFKAFEGFHFFRGNKRYEVLSCILPNRFHTVKCQEVLDVRTVRDYDEKEDIFGNVDAVNPRDRTIVDMGSEYLWFKPETIISGIKGLSNSRKRELEELAKLFNSFDSAPEFVNYCKEENEKRIEECKKEFVSTLHYKYSEDEMKTILQILHLDVN